MQSSSIGFAYLGFSPAISHSYTSYLIIPITRGSLKEKNKKNPKLKQLVLRCNSVPPPLKWQNPKQIHSQLGFYGTVGHENHQLAAKLLSKPNLGDENVWNTRSISQIVKWHVYLKKKRPGKIRNVGRGLRNSPKAPWLSGGHTCTLPGQGQVLTALRHWAPHRGRKEKSPTGIAENCRNSSVLHCQRGRTSRDPNGSSSAQRGTNPPENQHPARTPARSPLTAAAALQTLPWGSAHQELKPPTAEKINPPKDCL